MGKYYVTITGVALTTTNDILTLIAASNRRARVFEIGIQGLGTASAANTVRVARSTAGTTPGGSQTPAKLTSDELAAATLAHTTWATQPTIAAADVLLRIGINANGGAYRWVAMPGKEIELRNLEQLSFRGELGTSTVTMSVGIEED